MKIYLIAGEASGDLHGANLIKALRTQHPDVELRGWGGDLMQAAGLDLRKHYRELAFMGFWEVLKNLRTILHNLKFCRRELLDFQPDVVVFIDYPGFNLRVAKWLRTARHWFRTPLRTVYYISPQLWAWHSSRVEAIRRDIDQMLVILPFEVDFYQKNNLEVEFVGHPLLDVLPESAAVPTTSRRRIALLPGSRRQEVSRILPVMLSVVADFPQYEFVVAGATALPEAYYRSFMAQHPQVQLVQGATYDVLRSADAALVKSGTSTLETALCGVPQVVCYAGNPLSYAIARRVVQVKYISLVNLIADAAVVEELIQSELNPTNLRRALADILQPEKADVMRAAYRDIRGRLGQSGASRRAAEAVLRQVRVAATN
jgi:lipid-A-disaccharide synthase